MGTEIANHSHCHQDRASVLALPAKDNVLIFKGRNARGQWYQKKKKENTADCHRLSLQQK